MTDIAQIPDWIAVDWGTSNLRVWLMKGDQVIDRITSDQGMAGLEPTDFEDILWSLLQSHIGDKVVPVVICGMAGSRQGWHEAPYATAPCPAPSLQNAAQVQTANPQLDVYILPGIKQDDPADVMRGEETQIAGYLQQNPGFDGVLCLPGTHTKWVDIKDAQITNFRTFMTGELFAFLSEQSVLRFSVQGALDHDAFDTAIHDALSNPEAISADLFALRAGTLLASLTESAARGRLSGLLIGTELAGARPFWQNREVALIGAGGLVTLYGRALALQGVTTQNISGDDMVRAGLHAAYSNSKVKT